MIDCRLHVFAATRAHPLFMEIGRTNTKVQAVFYTAVRRQEELQNGRHSRKRGMLLKVFVDSNMLSVAKTLCLFKHVECWFSSPSLDIHFVWMTNAKDFFCKFAFMGEAAKFFIKWPSNSESLIWRLKFLNSLHFYLHVKQKLFQNFLHWCIYIYRYTFIYIIYNIYIIL